MRVLITGGGSDIGMTLAKYIISRGDDVIVTASSTSSLDKMMLRYDKANIPATPLELNLSQPQQSKEALQNITSKGLHAVILNAWSRTSANKRLHEIHLDNFSEHLQTNVGGNHWLLSQCLPSMMQQGFGRIVFISSMSTVTGTGRYGNYIAAKSAMEGVIKNVAVDYGNHNISANTIRLGIFKTERNKKYWQRDGYVERMSSVIPSGRLGEMNDLAHILTPFLSEHQYCNGSTLDVSGGLPCFAFSGLLKQ